MSTAVQRTPRSGRQSLFFQDLTSPVASRRVKFNSSGQAATESPLWRENLGGSELPPPPICTLEDRSNFSPDSVILDYPISPDATPTIGRSEASSYAISGGMQNQQGSTSLSWWSPAKSGSEKGEKGKSSPVEGIVQPGALITLPPPREVAKPEVLRNSLHAGAIDEEEWVTVYGFSPSDTNLVLREFEKCGVVLKHVPGPRDANWMHILYQNLSDARKALAKNGMQINGVLIVGVKPLDPMHHQALNQRSSNLGFMTLSQPSSRASDLSTSKVPSRPYYLQNGNSNARQAGGSIASPTKSLASKFLDLMFGV